MSDAFFHFVVSWPWVPIFIVLVSYGGGEEGGVVVFEGLGLGVQVGGRSWGVVRGGEGWSWGLTNKGHVYNILC